MRNSQNPPETDQPTNGDNKSPEHNSPKGSYYYDDSTGYETYIDDSESEDDPHD